MQLAIIENQVDAPAGLLGEWAEDRGVQVTTLRPVELAPGPAAARFDAVAVLGSDQSVHAPLAPWVSDELAFVHAALDAEVPVLGICFGAQVLAAALGGVVRPLPEPEIGWLELEAVDDLHAGPWLSWHRDAFTLPAGAHELARSAACAQAFRHGTNVGLQFHAEVTPAIVESWIQTARGTPVERRVDADGLRSESAQAFATVPARAFALFDRIAAGWRRRV